MRTFPNQQVALLKGIRSFRVQATETTRWSKYNLLLQPNQMKQRAREIPQMEQNDRPRHTHPSTGASCTSEK